MTWIHRDGCSKKCIKRVKVIEGWISFRAERMVNQYIYIYGIFFFFFVQMWLISVQAPAFMYLDGAIPFPTLPLFLFSSLFAPASLPIMLPAVICSSCGPERSAPANQRLQERCGPFHYGSTCALYTIWDRIWAFCFYTRLHLQLKAVPRRPIRGQRGGKKKKNQLHNRRPADSKHRPMFYLKPSLRFIRLNTNWKRNWAGTLAAWLKSHWSVLKSSISWSDELKNMYFSWMETDPAC